MSQAESFARLLKEKEIETSTALQSTFAPLQRGGFQPCDDVIAV